jgi:hypothetical protein
MLGVKLLSRTFVRCISVRIVKHDLSVYRFKEFTTLKFQLKVTTSQLQSSTAKAEALNKEVDVPCCSVPFHSVPSVPFRFRSVPFSFRFVPFRSIPSLPFRFRSVLLCSYTIEGRTVSKSLPNVQNQCSPQKCGPGNGDKGHPYSNPDPDSTSLCLSIPLSLCSSSSLVL